MVRGCMENRQCGAVERGVAPLIVPTPEGSNPQGDEKNIETKQIVLGDVVGLMRSF